ncbi:MAG: hypothetical protein HYZ00_06330 [Candidatus Hydrogenedentes bacterium]|nr:hypothetical protein [Candidatus Hydrogenedentota bacterium]
MRVTKTILLILLSFAALMSAVYAAGGTFDWLITTGGLRLSTGNDPSAAPPPRTIQFGAQGRIALEAADALVSVSDGNNNLRTTAKNSAIVQINTSGKAIMNGRPQADASRARVVASNDGTAYLQSNTQAEVSALNSGDARIQGSTGAAITTTASGDVVITLGP